ncbi:hypothetical protein B0T10DRAFT_410712 [Thelonectria olida]|uniref:Uncharacterized protein n=1 Tax=Thelonectria olida TaxID=1576542 RepID=A0A9P8VYD1_9HYPO|nr:hypothetical protein B0T10DRAFT_410712 [Thelonectria olida]
MDEREDGQKLKRPVGERPDADEPQAKRQTLDKPLTTLIHQKFRLDLYQALNKCKSWSKYYPILNYSHKIGEKELAIALHDSPEWLRLQALQRMERLNRDMKPRMLALISEIEIDKEQFDPLSIFPSVITGKSLDELFPGEEEILCSICGDNFRFSEAASKIKDGEMPLVGPCECVETSRE